MGENYLLIYSRFIEDLLKEIAIPGLLSSKKIINQMLGRNVLLNLVSLLTMLTSFCPQIELKSSSNNLQ